MEKRTPRHWIVITETETLLSEKINITLIYVLSTLSGTGKVVRISFSYLS